MTFEIQRFANVIHGDSSQNKLINTSDNAQIYGLSGSDTLESVNRKNALLIGGSGDDVLNITGGTGTLSGGSGADTFNLNYSASATLSAVIEDIEPDKDKVVITYDGDKAPELNYSISGCNVIWSDAEGYFNVTLKSYSSSSDFYDEECHEYIWDVFWLVNQERERQGLSPLVLSDGLNDAASIRAVELDELYSHTRPDGTSCFTAIEKSYNGGGENIYVSPTNPEAAMIGWMNSDGHRANILTSSFKFIGIGYYYYEESKSWKDHWVQMFGGGFGDGTSLTAAEILNADISVKAGTIPSVSASDFAIAQGNSYVGSGGNFKVADDFSGTIRIDTDAAVTIDGTAADNLEEIKVLAYSKTANFMVNSGEGNSHLIVERASLHGEDISSWESKNYNHVTIDGGAGNDTIENRVFYASISGGNGNDTVINNAFNVTISGGTGNDSVISKGNNAKMFGGNGDDTLSAEVFSAYNWDTESWENTVYSGATIDGGAGDDYIYSHNSGTTISGGAGADHIYNYNSGTTISGGDDGDLIVNGEFFANGGMNVRLFGGDDVDTITSSGSNSLLDGGGGDDFIYNGKYFYEPWNVYYGSSYNGEHDDSLKSSNVTIIGGAGNDSIDNNGERVIYVYNAGDGDDTISGYGDSDTIKISDSYSTQASGSDVVVKVGSGSILLKNASGKTLNIISGGGDTDTVPAGISVKGATLTASSVFSGSEINLADYSGVTKVNASDLARGVTITGTAAANSLKGGKGADTISGGAGKDTELGGAGNDVLYGGADNDLLKGDAGNDTLYGGIGNDTLTGGAGSNVFIYESGNDIITDYVAGTDKIKLSSASITDSSLSGSNVVLKTSGGNLTVKNGKGKKITVVDANGNETTNIYPLDTMPAGLTYDSAKKTLTVGTSYSGAAIDLANFATTTKTVDASKFTKTLKITGSSRADSLVGGAKADTISGGKGNDTLTGNGGNDVFVYSTGDGADVIADFSTGDKISLASGSVTSAALKNSDMTFKIGSGSITVKNGKGKDISIGGAIYHDNLIYDSKKTAVTLGSAFSGSLKISDYNSKTKIINASAVTKAVNIVGNSQANSIFGGAKADTISGGKGNDTLTGNGGNDVFVYGSGDGKDVITDYTAGQDKIKISSGTISKTSYSGNNVIFTVGSGSLTVKNGKGKKITITDAAGKTSTKTYNGTAVYGSSSNLFVDENFIGGTTLDEISAEKYSVEQICATVETEFFAQEIQPVYSSTK